MMNRREFLASTSFALWAKQASPVERTKACFDQIRKHNSRLNAFITLTEESALAQAKALESGRSRGPLHGMPIALKDLYDTAGVRTTAGSRHWSDRVPKSDAEVVRRLKEAGAVIVGKANMDEFAYNFTGETSAFGQCRNPWSTSRSPGGSSGGSAVAVVTGMCAAALGSDTGGSIRLPASLCGITGFKPTFGAVPLDGAAPLAWSLDHAGPMCRSAADAALLFEIMSRKQTRHAQVRIKTLRIGVPRAHYYDGLDPQVARTIASATAELAKLTAGAKDVTPPSLTMSKTTPELPQTYGTVIYAEAFAFHRERMRMRPEIFHPGTRQTIALGQSISAADYIDARRDMDRLRAADHFADVDVFVTPTAPAPAFPIGEARLVFLRNTAPWNLLGLPTISVPCGFTQEGLPVGLQITGAAGRDDVVLALAMAFQRVTDWHQRSPALG